MAEIRRTAIVTGAGSGIGAAVATRLTASGYEVVALDRSFPEATSGKAQHRVTGDISDPDTARAALDRVSGPVDAIVNAAAIRPTGPATQVSDDDWRRTFEVNVVGSASLVKAAAQRLRDDHASIVNIASGAAFGKPSLGAYGATKAALVSWSRTLATELAPRGIRVNVVVPGATETGMLVEARATGTGTDSARAARNLGGVVLDPDTVAAAVEGVIGLPAVTGAIIPIGLLPWVW
ncbi:SDR family NAD(P)-dependent oxidoreductase [Streptomyces sp. T028]|uniref:SDR family NAD(P)-dependent oxidoreductase n=1 Tax=Streptomyces sp. T028 TaxID=3394379 RepID=UPI003A867BD2